jgi:hypothetical protein
MRECADAEHGFFRELDSLMRSGRHGRS